MQNNIGIPMDKAALDSMQVCVEVPQELRGSLLCEANTVTISDSLLRDDEIDTGNIVIRPISTEKMEEIAQRVSKNIHMLPYHIIRESLVSPDLSISEIRNLNSRVVDFIFAEIYKINGFQCGP